MIEITDKKQCCGCESCMQSCPKHCISLRVDNEGFLYPEVNTDSCVNCGLCDRVCPIISPMDERPPLKVAAVMNRNEAIRLRSSSGGVFHALAQKIIAEGGVVFGARFDEQWQVVIDYTEDIKGVEAFMGSKYVQARVGNAFAHVKRFLQQGRKVLYSGTPCQIAGLNHYLRKPYKDLLTVDFICHGTPSPKVWERYLDEITPKNSSIKNVKFRDKYSSWKNYGFYVSYDKQSRTISLQSCFLDNPYMKAFLSDLILRPSCHDCKAKSGRSHSDITIADFWGIEHVFPQMDDDKGTGMVFVNSEKGQFVVGLPNLAVMETTYEEVKHLNKPYHSSVQPNPHREYFFDHLDNTTSVIKLISRCTRPRLKKRLLTLARKYKEIILNSVRGGGEKIPWVNYL